MFPWWPEPLSQVSAASHSRFLIARLGHLGSWQHGSMARVIFPKYNTHAKQFSTTSDS